MTKIQRVAKAARTYFESDDWNFHVLRVLYYAKKLNSFYKANKTIIELAVYLHDTARSKKDSETHHIEGAKIAKKIMTKHGYSKEIIRGVIHCILAHRSADDFIPETIEAKIVANADSLSHFDMVPLFFYWRAAKNTFPESVAWIENKLKRDWSKKLTLPQSKKLVAKKYELIKVFLKDVK